MGEWIDPWHTLTLGLNLEENMDLKHDIIHLDKRIESLKPVEN